MSRKLFFAVALLAVSAAAQSKPDFGGTWKLNPAKSDFGPLPPPDTRTDVIVQDASGLSDAVDTSGPQGQMDLKLAYKFDGTETVNDFRGNAVKSTAKWDGAALVVDSKLNMNDQEIGLVSKWTLSDDGKTLTMATHLSSPMGEADQTYVLEKQTVTAAVPSTAPAAAPATGAPSSAPAAPAAPSTAPTPATTSANASHPDFSGIWKLDPTKSDFGPMPPPDSRIDKIAQTGSGIKDSFQQTGGDGDQTGEFDYTTDGKPCQNKFRGIDMLGTAVWDGAALLVDNKLNMDGNDIDAKIRWDLSPDGKMLTMTADINTPMGELQQKLLFSKQSD